MTHKEFSSKGGSVTGKSKSRPLSTKQAKKMAAARWANAQKPRKPEKAKQTPGDG